jgi:SAM-dependent methyltransferase
MEKRRDPASEADIGLWDAQFEVFKTMTPPLRPHASEVEIMQALVDSAKQTDSDQALQALILGLTPEFVGLNWPQGSRVVVADRSSHVAREWWPGDIPGQRELVLAEWLDLPFDAEEFHLIFGDGVFNFMPYPNGFKEFSSKLSRLLKPRGKLAIRVFIQPNPPENPKQLLEEYYQSETIDYFGFRFRLAQSIQESVEKGLFLNKDTVDAWLTEHGVDLNEMYQKSGHTPPRVAPLPKETRDTFRVSYPTLRQFEEPFEAHLDIGQTLYGDHALASRTPIFIAATKT